MPEPPASGPSRAEPTPPTVTARAPRLEDADAEDAASAETPEELVGEPAAETDVLDRICPYLLSEDGTYRSAQPDPGHRCTAQDPASTLPPAFQERYCLTERHVRCEMFKYAQSARSAALDEEGIPAAQVQSARFKPSVRSVPLALGPSGEVSSAQGGSRRPVLFAAAGIGILAAAVFLVVLAFGGSGQQGGTPAASPSPAASQPLVAERTAAPTAAARPTPTPTALQSPATDVSPAPSVVTVGTDRLIEYQVQEGEALIKIAATFETSRRKIIQANEGMAEKKPYTQPGDIIIVPVSAALALEEVEAAPGFIQFLR